MSNANGAVRFNDGAVMFYEYQGTSDVCNPILRKTLSDVSHWWRKHDEEAHARWKACKHDGEEVTIYSDYGGGFCWPGRACRECSCITQNTMPWEDMYEGGEYFRAGSREPKYAITDGRPEWVLVAFERTE